MSEEGLMFSSLIRLCVFALIVVMLAFPISNTCNKFKNATI